VTDEDVVIVLAFATELECRHALARAGGIPESGAPLRIAGTEFLVCITGVGPVAAALSAGAFLERHSHAAGVVNLGICGSFDPDRPLGETCVASAEIWPEYGVNCADGSDEPFSFQMLPDVRLNPVNRLDLDPASAARAMGLELPEAWTQGPSLTVAGVSGDPARAAQLLARHEAATENMEGFSLALAARRKALPFLEVRTVSNPVGVRDKRKWNFRLALETLQNILPTLAGAPA
jgi:futalosine hydrolase